MSRINRFLPPFTGEVARTKCATMGAVRRSAQKTFYAVFFLATTF
jgi:hypothetical protein